MLKQSLLGVRIWTVVLALAAAWLASVATARADQPAATSPTLQTALDSFFAAPKAAQLETVHRLLVSEQGYNPYSDDLALLGKLVQAGKYDDAKALFPKSQPNLSLSPRAYQFEAEAETKNGDASSAAMSLQLRDRCLAGILDSGDGSQSRPFRIARLSDEADVLELHFKARIESQALVFQGDKKYDSVVGSDGMTRWFDLGMFFERATLAEASPLAASADRTPPARSVPATLSADGTPPARPVPATSSGNSPVAEFDPSNPDAAIPVDQEAASKALAAGARGRDAYHAGQNDVALSALNEAIAIDPRNASIYVDRGNVWYVKKDCAQAIHDFSEAIRLDPNYASAYSNRAFALSTQGEFDKAIADFNAAIRLKANFGRAYNGRGYAFHSQGLNDAAIADFDEAIRLDPNYAAAYENRSAAYAKQGNKSLADADAVKARELRHAKAAPPATATAEKTAGN